MTCIVTGFERFGQLGTNPSQTVVASLPERHYVSFGGKKTKPLKIETAVLPVCCEAASKALRPVFRKRENERAPMLMLGVAAGSKRISLERFALNIQDYSIEDNGGHKRVGRKIARNGPDAIATTVDVEELRSLLSDRGISCQVSNHAGAFLCNEVYYRALNKSRKSKHPTSILFVHLPLPEVYAEETGLADAAEAIEVYKDCVLLLTRCL